MEARTLGRGFDFRRAPALVPIRAARGRFLGGPGQPPKATERDRGGMFTHGVCSRIRSERGRDVPG